MDLCSFQDCGRRVNYGGLCAAHNVQKTKGEELRPIRRYNTGTKPACTFNGCDRDQYSKGLCASHDNQRRKGKELTPIKSRSNAPVPCTVCTNGALAVLHTSGEPLCRKHYNRWKKYGDARVSSRNDVRALVEKWAADAVATRNRSDCWLDWLELPLWDGTDGHGATVTNGYPTVGLDRVASIVLEADGRPRPAAPDNMALSTCHNRLCLNPDHMYWGGWHELIQIMNEASANRKG